MFRYSRIKCNIFVDVDYDTRAALCFRMNSM